MEPQPQSPLKTVWEGVYFDGRTASRQRVTITVTGNALHVVKQDGKQSGPDLWWPYEEIRQTQGFYSGEQVRLEKGDELPEAIVVDDDAFLAAIHQIAPDAPARFHNPAHRSHRFQFLLLAGAGTILVVWALYFWGIPVLADQAAARVPVSWEEQLGRAVVGEMAPVDKRCADPERIGALNQIVFALTVTSPEPDSPYTFVITVVDDPAVNAFAAPGGQIVIYQGLLEKTENPEEMAGVLAHEIQHIVQRHATKALFREMSMSVLLAAAVGDASGLATVLGAAQTIGALRYRRRDEAEADREGMKAVQAAGIDPMGMIRFLNKLEESSGDMPRAAEYFSTHPLTRNRIEQLSRLAAQADYTPVPLLPGYQWAEMGKICDEQP
ncbi:MAG: M48 family metallopeptidase [Acidobacteria bacterium]|nr:M48 family metallopeptidase [Acidobacteriota bacterium]